MRLCLVTPPFDTLCFPVTASVLFLVTSTGGGCLVRVVLAPWCSFFLRTVIFDEPVAMCSARSVVYLSVRNVLRRLARGLLLAMTSSMPRLRPGPQVIILAKQNVDDEGWSSRRLVHGVLEAGLTMEVF